GCRDDDAAGASLDVFVEADAAAFLAAALAVGEEAGRLDRHLDAKILPGQLAGVTLGEDLYRLAVDDELSLGRVDAAREPAVDGAASRAAPVRLGSPDLRGWGRTSGDGSWDRRFG